MASLLGRAAEVCEADIEVSTKLMYCERCDYAICEACAVGSALSGEGEGLD